jgi:hypothetical protein
MDSVVLLAQLRGGPLDAAVDRAAEALAEAGEALSALAVRDDYDTATMWWAAGTVSEAYAAILPYTGEDLPDPPTDAGMLADDPALLIDVLDAAADALLRASRIATEPDRIYSLAHAGILAEQARGAFVKGRVSA